MYINLFAQTTKIDEAKLILKEIIDALNKEVLKYTFIKIEPYWKIKELTHVQAEFSLTSKLSIEERKHFLFSVSDKWTYCGNPILDDEVVASIATEGCNYIKSGIEMINIIF